jgi:xanthine permease XanP
VIIAVGIELGKIGLGVLLDEFALSEVRTELMAITALCVLVTMTTLAVWAKGLPRLLCALIGILVGYVISAFLGYFQMTLKRNSRQVRFSRSRIRGSFRSGLSRR